MRRGFCEHRLPRRDPRIARARDADDPRDARTALANRRHVRQRLRIDERDLRLEVVQPVFERLGAEQKRQRHGDGANAIYRDVRNDGLGPLREDQRDLVAACDPHRTERIGEPVRLLFQLPERVHGGRAVLVFPVQRDAVAVGRPASATGLGDRKLRRHIPAVPAMQLRIPIGAH